MSSCNYIDGIFALSASEAVNKAVAEGRIWTLQQELEFWCVNNCFEVKGARYLMETYRVLGCHINCWYIWNKYVRDKSSREVMDAVIQRGLGLDSGFLIRPDCKFNRSRYEPGNDYWIERDNIMRRLRENPSSVSLWQSLVEHYCTLEELLEAVWILLIIKMNFTAKIPVLGFVNGELESIRITGTAGAMWTFAGEATFVTKVAELLGCDMTKNETALRISKLFEETFRFPLSSDVLLKRFKWRN